VVHCHDWHTAAIPVYLRTRLKDHPFWQGVPIVFTIHNLGYQGRYVSSLLPVTGMGWDLFNQNCLEYYGDVNLMKGGIAFATKINTVSRTYAREIQTPAYGQGLDGFLRTRCEDLSGIVNGIDYSEWNPAADPHIAAPFSPDDLSGKAACKEDLRARFSLARTDAPLFAMVSRLVWEKGIDLMVSAMDRILSKGAQLVVLGKGDPRIELAMEQAAARYPDQVSVVLGYDEALAHKIYAGADFFIMPSQTEPCGLSQMYSLKYGAIPVVRKTGGLADTVTDVTPATLLKNRATGIVFRLPTAEALGRALERAMRMYQEPDTLRSVQRAGMRNDLSWDRASREYADLYRKAIAAND
jgi:starch synthase